MINITQQLLQLIDNYGSWLVGVKAPQLSGSGVVKLAPAKAWQTVIDPLVTSVMIKEVSLEG